MLESINDIIKNSGVHKGGVSDGYHTFDELYNNRMILFYMVCQYNKDKAFKSWKHHDGAMYEDYFICGINTPEGQFTYHYHKANWNLFDIPEVDKAPEWDGHTAEDVGRLISLLQEGVKC